MRYFLSMTGIDGSEREVSREDWISAERRAGFFPKGNDHGQPATGGFSSGGISGRIVYERASE